MANNKKSIRMRRRSVAPKRARKLTEDECELLRLYRALPFEYRKPLRFIALVTAWAPALSVDTTYFT